MITSAASITAERPLVNLLDAQVAVIGDCSECEFNLVVPIASSALHNITPHNLTLSLDAILSGCVLRWFQVQDQSCRSDFVFGVLQHHAPHAVYLPMYDLSAKHVTQACSKCRLIRAFQ